MRASLRLSCAPGDAFSKKLAEREGFEPSIRFPVYTLSKRAPSATRPPLRSQRGADYSHRAARHNISGPDGAICHGLRALAAPEPFRFNRTRKQRGGVQPLMEIKG